MLQKRKDIQWLRAFAIAAVLGFHFLPKIFPYGYFGVDVFFVISGYLMTSILSKQNEASSFKKLLLNFYSRRICRIFPSYFIVLFVTLAAGHFILIDFDFTFLSKETLWASFFGTNLKSLFEKESYFHLTSEYRFLLHTWSLGVEIQFYFIAPFLIINFVSKNPLFRATLLMGFSAGLQLYFHNHSIGFDFFLCRLWQFLAGTLAFYHSDEAAGNNYVLLSSDEIVKKSIPIYYSYTYYFLFTLLIFLCFAPQISIFPEFIIFSFRLFSTFFAAFLIFLASKFQLKLPQFFDKGLTYLGDISYSVYLFHWPILLFAKYTGVYNQNDVFSLICLLLIIFIISALQYHLIETKLSKLSSSFIYGVIIILFGIVFYIAMKNRGLSSVPLFYDISSSKPISDAEAIKINQEMVIACNKIPIKCEKDKLLSESFAILRADDNLEGRCVLPISTHGSKTAVVLGNSFAMKHIGAIIASLNASKHVKGFSKIYLVSWKSCPIFESTLSQVAKHWECVKVKGLLIPFLTKLKPSLIILLNRLDFLQAFASLNPKSSKAFQGLQQDFLQIANLSTHTIVIEPHHTVGNTMKAAAITIAQKLSQKLPLVDLDKSSTSVHKELDFSWNQMKAAMAPCKNCHTFEVLKYFCNKTICSTYDKINRLSYFCDGYHFTPIASQKIVNPMRDLLNNLIF